MFQRSIFDGIPEDELQEFLSDFERRRFRSGSVVLAEGDSLFETYVVESGTADVFVSDDLGVEHRIGLVTPGGMLGEMSLFTGEPAAGTVRATTDLDVCVISEAEFDRLADRYPLIYRNIGAILSERLDRSNRRPLRDPTGRVTILRDWDAPPLLGYAIACSIAWHLQQATLLLVLDDSPAEELAALAREQPRPPAARAAPDDDGRRAREARADVMLVTSALDFAAATLAARIEDLHSSYEHVLVQVKGDVALEHTGRTLHLLAADAALPRTEPGDSVIRAGAAWSGRTPDVHGVVTVPEVGAATAGLLANGVLSTGSEMGAAVGCVARDLCRLKVGVALGGGSAKGYAHVGVLRVLLRAGLPIDYLAGTSIGSVVAALYALGYDLDDVTKMLDSIGSGAFRPRLSTRSLLSFSAVRNRARAIAGETRIEDLRVPLAITAADVSTGQEVVFRHGLLWPAVAASIAIPGIYPAQRIGDYSLVDGGVLHPVPSNIAADMGADMVVGVRLSPATHGRVEATAVEPHGRSPSVFHTMMRSIEMMQSSISTHTAATATILITPVPREFAPIGLRHWKAAHAYIELGEAAAEAALPRLVAALPWMRS